MNTHRTGSTFWSALFVFAEYYILYSKGVFFDMELQYSKGIGGFLLDVIACGFGIAVVTTLVCSTVIFRSEYFGFPFDSVKEIQAESGRVAKIGLIIAGIFYAIIMAVIIF